MGQTRPNKKQFTLKAQKLTMFGPGIH